MRSLLQMKHLGFCILLIPLVAHSVPEPILRVSFDGDAEARTASGSETPVIAKDLAFVQGLHGRALHLPADGGAQLAYAAKDRFPREQGTISLWYRPDSVAPLGNGLKEGAFLLATPPPDTRLGSGTVWLWRTGGSVRGDVSDDRDRYALNHRTLVPGAWNHLSMTWSVRGGVAVYVNGRRGGVPMDAYSALAEAMKGGERPMDLTWKAPHATELFYLGCNAAGRTMAGAIDDFRLYAEALDDAAVRALYEAEVGRAVVDCTPPDYEEIFRNHVNPYVGKEGDGLKLVKADEFTLDRIPSDPMRFVSVGGIRAGALNGVPYLESGVGANDRFGIRFRLDGKVPLYLFEIDYPDDACRTADIIIQASGKDRVSGADGSDYVMQVGYACGDEYPNTGRILTQRCLYWTISDDVTLIAMTARANAPAAVSAVRVYRVVDGKLPPAKIAASPANADGWRRDFALYFEDPAIMADFARRGSAPETIPELIDRTAATMKFTGQNLLCYPGVWYAGLPIGEEYQPRPHARDYRRAWYAAFDREGLGFMPTINQNEIQVDPNLVTRRKIESGALHSSVVSIYDDGKTNPGRWHGSPPNYNVHHPEVQRQVFASLDQLIEEGRNHASFKGVVLHLPHHSSLWFGDLHAGYNDYTVQAFARERHVDLPSDVLQAADSDRGKAYADWIRANCLEAWIDWRCEVVAAFYRRLAARLAAARPDLKLVVNAFLLPNWRLPDFGSPNFIPMTLRRAGLDPKKLANVPNIAICQSEIPADYRWFGPPPGLWGTFAKTAYPLHRELYLKQGDWGTLEGAVFPWVNQHDRYWESDVGRSKRSLSNGWLTEHPWRVTTINPSGRYALRHYAVPLRYHDVRVFSKGGYLIGTYGTEDVVVPFMRAFRALPAVEMTTVGDDEFVKVRSCEFKGRRYWYAVNTDGVDRRVSIGLPEGTLDLVTGERMKKTPEVVLRPYELRSFAKDLK